MGRASSRNRENGNAYRIILGKPEGKRPLGKSRRIWVDNIKMYHRVIGWGGMDWIDLAHDMDQCKALVNAVISFGFHIFLGSF
jgi:hypothetical protein